MEDHSGIHDHEAVALQCFHKDPEVYGPARRVATRCSECQGEICELIARIEEFVLQTDALLERIRDESGMNDVDMPICELLVFLQPSPN